MPAWFSIKRKKRSSSTTTAATLTELPEPRFASIRTSSSALGQHRGDRSSSVHHHPVDEPDAVAVAAGHDRPQSGGIQEWGYAGLSRSPNTSQQEQEKEKEREGDGARREQRSRSSSQSILLPSHELVRARIEEAALHARPSRSSEREQSEHGRKQKRWALVAGIWTLLVMGATAYMLFEAIRRLVHVDKSSHRAYAIVQVSALAFVLLSCLLTVCWLRLRRGSGLTIWALTGCFLSSAIHLTLAVVNAMLVIIWKKALTSRCSWAVDALWRMPRRSGEESCSTLWQAWLLAALVRFLVVLIFGGLWLNWLRLYMRVLQAAQLAHHAVHGREASHPDRLPEMQQYEPHLCMPSDPSTQPAESDSIASRSIKDNASVVDNGNKSRAKVWLASKFWGVVARAFGVTPYELSVDTSPTEKTYDEKEEGSAGPQPLCYMPAARMSTDSATTTFEGTDETLQPCLSVSSSTLVHDARMVSPSQATHRGRHGSSGSTQGAIVYVRMSDGRLVRKLSTIESYNEQQHAQSIDAGSVTNFHGAIATNGRASSMGAESILENEAALKDREAEIEVMQDSRINEWREETVSRGARD